MKAYDRITDLIGGTPLLRLNRYMAEKKLETSLYMMAVFCFISYPSPAFGRASGGEFRDQHSYRIWPIERHGCYFNVIIVKRENQEIRWKKKGK